MLESLKEETFAPLLNTKFNAYPEPSRRVELELVEIDGGQNVPGLERFSLTFRGPLDSFLPQRIYEMEHEQTGAFELFIVPIRQDAAGFYYEAIFSRVVPKG